MKQAKTIPFNWEEYNNNRDKYKVFTRGGDEVTQLTKFEKISTYCQLVGVKNGFLQTWHDKGQFTSVGESNFDLQLQYEEEVVESWVNLYKADDGTLYTSNTYTSKNYAENSRNLNNYIKTINLNDLV
jgi:hypothetical protein